MFKCFFFLCEEVYIERNMQTLTTQNLFFAFFIKSMFFFIFRCLSQKRAKIRYNVEEAIQKFFEPSLDSDIGDLSDSESEEDISMNDKDEVLLDEQSNSEQSENESESDCELNPAPTYQKANSENVSTCFRSTSNPIRRVTRAHSKPGTSGNNEDNMKRNLELLGNDIDSSDTESEYLSDSNDVIAIQLRKHKCGWRKIQPTTPTSQYVGDPSGCHQRISIIHSSDEITELIVEQTNRYSVMKKVKSVNTNVSDMLPMFWNPYDDGHFLPYSNYWAVETKS